jgi:hypothetical protein
MGNVEQRRRLRACAEIAAYVLAVAESFSAVLDFNPPGMDRAPILAVIVQQSEGKPVTGQVVPDSPGSLPDVWKIVDLELLQSGSSQLEPVCLGLLRLRPW